jgi:hypothetical protein
MQSAPDDILPLLNVDLTVGILRTLDNGFYAIQSLERIIVISEEFDIDEEDMAVCESLKQKLPSPNVSGW